MNTTGHDVPIPVARRAGVGDQGPKYEVWTPDWPKKRRGRRRDVRTSQNPS